MTCQKNKSGLKCLQNEVVIKCCSCFFNNRSAAADINQRKTTGRRSNSAPANLASQAAQLGKDGKERRRDVQPGIFTGLIVFRQIRWGMINREEIILIWISSGHQPIDYLPQGFGRNYSMEWVGMYLDVSGDDAVISESIKNWF